MIIGKQISFVFLGMSVLLAAGTLSSTAQEPAAKAKDASAKKAPESPTTTSVPQRKNDPSRRVPSYFGQIGLTQDQRESIYKIRRTHQDKIDTLKKQIAEAESQTLLECEAVLNETQRKLLQNLRTAPKNGSAAKTAK